MVAATALWRPSDAQVQRAALLTLREEINANCNPDLPDYAALRDFSVSQQSAFWRVMWDELGIKGEAGETAFLPPSQASTAAQGTLLSPGTPKYRRNAAGAQRCDAGVTVSPRRRGRGAAELARSSRAGSQASGYLKRQGWGRTTALPLCCRMHPQPLSCCWQQPALGAVVSSCSPDFGDKEVLDRFGQIAPKIFIAVDGYVYGGKQFDTRQKAQRVLAGLPSLSGLYAALCRRCAGTGFYRLGCGAQRRTRQAVKFTPLPL